MSDVFNLIGGVFGGGGSEQSGASGFFGIPEHSEYENAQAGQQGNVNTAQSMWNTLFNNTNQAYSDTSGLRTSTLKRAQDVLAGRFDPASSPAYNPMRKAVEQSYSGAKNDILANLPNGGVQQQALADLGSKRAGSLSDVMSQIYSGELSNAQNMANTSGTNMMTGLNSAIQGGAIPGQMMSSILEFLAKRMGYGVQAADAASPF
jgi:hypothetical protein